ncbi:MAG: response regulator transcription factor [Patescibacteria group bacterium]|nr:response regulator transcription factor [Patescibacteria group bacterium]
MNIFIIDDIKSISLIIHKTLSTYGYIPHTVTSQDQVKKILQNNVYDLVIQNTILSHQNSNDLCKHIRKNFPKIYIMGISNQGTLDQKIDFLNNGADDCLSYPFPTQELLARIQAMLRRPRLSLQPKLKYENLTLVPSSRKAYYDKLPLSLTKKEFHLLNYFVINKERTITRSELLDHVWDYKRITNSNTVDVHIQRLRQKLRSCNNTCNNNGKNYIKNDQNFTSQTIIKTVHGIGYKLDRDSTQDYGKYLRNLPEL